MSKLRLFFQYASLVLTIYLCLIWLKVCPRPACLGTLDIEPLTIILASLTGILFIFWKEKTEPPPPHQIIVNIPPPVPTEPPALPPTAPMPQLLIFDEKNRLHFLSKLPNSASHIFGREKEFALLDQAWGGEKRQHLVQFIAWGGAGKTGLVTRWLYDQLAKGSFEGMPVYAWSFYSQGAGDQRQSTAEPFLVHILKWFGEDETKLPISQHDRGVLLAKHVRRQRSLLLLDGMEPLQFPPGEQHGQLKDLGLRALLRELASENPGLCILTSRIEVKDLRDFKDNTARVVELERLSPQAGAALLRHLGVSKGTQKELETAADEFKGHALALRLLGNYLSVLHHGDIRRRDRVRQLTAEESDGGHAKRVMEAYVNWFGQDVKYQPELTLLCLVGLFDRPAPVGALEALAAAGGDAKGLLNLKGLVNLSPEKQKYTLKHLADLDLLTINYSTATLLQTPARLPGFEGVESLDAHPLVREFFGEKLQKTDPKRWRKCHATLYEYYKALPEKELPDTLAEMEPLFSAVAHGCKAGLQQEVLDEVFWKRIRRGKENYSLHKLGAFGSDMTALSWFFERLWEQPAAGLMEADKALVLSWAGFSLRALGRLGEAAQPMKASLELVINKEDWKNIAIVASNLSELYLTAGDVRQAVRYGEESVKYAEWSGDGFQKESKRATHADALHQAGDLQEAARLFAEAERMQKGRQPEYLFLFSMWGFRYCDLLMGRGRGDEILERGKFALEISLRNNWLLITALDKLTLGKAYSLLTQADPYSEHPQPATRYLDQAVEGLRKAGAQEFIPFGLLLRAAWHRHTRAWQSAEADLAEAWDIAEPSGMKLHLCDYHLEMSRLRHAQGNLPEAKTHLQAAKKLIEETGYHRRDKELDDLSRQLSETPAD